MSTVARVAEPIVLASYTLPARADWSSERRKHVYAHVTSSERELVTVAVQGDGVHILDTLSMHSVASYTMGPSATFACAAQSQQTNDGQTATYAALASGHTAAELCYWAGSITDKQEGTSQVKQSKTVKQNIHSIHLCARKSRRFIIITRDGRVLLADNDLAVLNAPTSSRSNNTSVRKAFVFDGPHCGFLPSNLNPRPSNVVVLFIEEDDALDVQVVPVNDEVAEQLNCDVSMSSNDIVDISCDPSGHISVLRTTGAWQLYTLGADGPSVKLTERNEKVQLSKTLSLSGPSILAMGSSHVLLAAAEVGNDAGLVLLLWDLRFSAVLAHSTRPMPSSVASKDGSVELQLAPAKGSQAVLIVSPPTAPAVRGKGKAKGGNNTSLRSTVLLVSCTVPTRSSIASALGHADRTARWLAPKPSAPVPGADDENAQLESKREAMLNALEVAMTQASRDAVEKIFFDWHAQESAVLKERLARRTKQKAGDALAMNGNAEEHESDGALSDRAEQEDQDASGKRPAKQSRALTPAMTFKFVTRLLSIIFPPAADLRSAPYPWRIMEYLVDRNVISHSMVKEGLIPALQARSDWANIVKCLTQKSVPDVPETELLRLLKVVMAGPQKTKDKDAMDVDSGAHLGKMPQLPTFLSLCVSYPTSSQALRSAMREYLTQAEDIMTVLTVLDTWVGNWSGIDDIARLHIPHAEQDAKQSKRRAEYAARFQQTIAFLQTLLDATFLTLVQHPPLHPLLQRLQERLTPEIDLHIRMELLRGPLEQFERYLRRQKEKEKEDKERTSAGRKGLPKRHDRPRYHQPIGLYQVERFNVFH
ncbi:hypothetical protein AURDEDRAFT_180088 [Auricularia subglabra TFB-10046 SS5]|nr:hypothetical protein AURDEDRAFT_180088 [Auricularia subglabra TFB-10046 SS5]